jgi:lipoprotein-releasing system permease protein
VFYSLLTNKSYVLEGVDANYSKVNAIESKLYNGQWLQPNTYQVVVGYGIAQKIGIA